MDQFSERVCYINSIERSKTPENTKMDGDQSVSPVLSRNKKHYRPVKRDSRVSLEKTRVIPNENNRVEIAQVVQTSAESSVSNKFKSDILSKIYEGFKTATGKNLTVSENKLRHQATKIFGDILHNTPAPADQNILNKSDSAVKRSFLTKVSANPTAALENKSAWGDRNLNSLAIKDSLTPEELAKCFESDVFSQLPSKEFCRINRATEVYSNTNYNEQSSECDTLATDKKKSFDINEISDSELVYLADTAEFLSAQNQKIINKKVANRLPARKSPPKAQNKHAKLRQVLSKHIVDPPLSPSNLNTQSPNLSKNVYELHKNYKFTAKESEHQSINTDHSVLTNIMKMFGVKSGFSQDDLAISREVFDRHSKVLEAVVHTMQVDQQLQQKKQLKKTNKSHSTKHKSQKDKDSTTKRKLEDRSTSPVEVNQPQPIITPEKKRAKEETDNSDVAPSAAVNNKKLQIEIGTTNIKININSSGVNEPHIGFKSASGRDINITPLALEAAKNMFQSAEKEVEASTSKILEANFCALPSEADSISTVNDSYVKQTVNDDLAQFTCLPEPVVLGFASASGNKINVSVKSMQKAQQMYEQAIDNDKEIKFDLLNLPDRDQKAMAVMFSVDADAIAANKPKENHSLDFASAAGLKIVIEEDKIKCTKNIFTETSLNCFATAAGKNIKVSELSLHNANKIFESVEVSDQQIIMPSDTSLKSAQELIGDAVSSMDTALNKLCSTKSRALKLKQFASKKRLGMTSAKCKPITISKHNLEKAKSFFDDTEDLRDIESDVNASLVRRNNQSSKLPVRNMTPSTNKSDVSSCSLKPLNNLAAEDAERSRNSSPARAGNKPPIHVSTPTKEALHQNSSFNNINITPIKCNQYYRSTRNNLSTIQESPSVLLMEQSSSDLTQIKANLDEECEALERKLNVLKDRKSALDLQESIMSTSSEDYKKPKPGILYLLKQRSNRVPLKALQLCSEENVEFFNVDATLLDFNYGLAEQLHFNSSAVDGHCATMKTKDSCIVVPSVNDSIGLTEIVRGFQTMPGVDPDLLPKGWIVNHFKMIVWKLASYERIFPHYFKNSLCLENVVQQLKYRYDREIDRAHRPAIRKITEKDDVPQKRMVLCVANIHEVPPNKFELDLSDGWYLIRTTIDHQLSRHVKSGKIRLGSKLMIQNAELVNCDDGHHPLQLPDHVRLRINLNSTRRSPWYSKLGYQKYTRPIPIRISTMHLDGGQIAFVKVYINRVYPIRYLEHDSTSKIWRNPKAEQKRAQEFEREKSNRVEKIQEKIMQDLSKPKSKPKPQLSSSELSTINCPEDLHDLLESSNDPESFIERLSSTQRTSLMAFLQTNNFRKQEEVLAKVTEEVNAQKTMERNVTGVLRLLVTDSFDNAMSGVVLNIWRPTEDILDSLVEDSVVSVFNVVPNKIRNELSSTARTYFKVEETYCQKSNRQIVPIAMTIDSYYKPVFNEMDTIGLVVQTVVEKHRQELWLCDFQGRLLLVQIHDGSKCCCLLDNIARGDCVAVLNVLVHKPQKGYGRCVANQLSLVSTYPQIKSHRESLEVFRQRLPKDVKQLLNDCDIKIEKYRLSAEIVNKSDNFLSSKLAVHTSFDDYVDEEAFNSSGLTAADVALSLIQIDPE